MKKQAAFHSVCWFVIPFVVASTLACSLLPSFLGGGEPTPTPAVQRIPDSGTAIPPPTGPVASPTRTGGQPTPPRTTGTNDLEIVKSVIMQCRESSMSPQLTTDYWGTWEIRNNRKDRWVKLGEGQATLIGSGGLVLSTQKVGNFAIAPDTIDWIPSPGLIQNGSTISGGGSKVQDIRLDFTNLSWVPVDDSISRYKYDIVFGGHQTDDTDYPRHSFTVVVANKSDFVMKQVQVFGVFFDTHGNGVDIAYAPFTSKTSNDIPFGQSKAFTALSLSRTGRCVGPKDPAGYTLDYWVSFETITGQSVTRYFTTVLK